MSQPETCILDDGVEQGQEQEQQQERLALQSILSGHLLPASLLNSAVIEGEGGGRVQRVTIVSGDKLRIDGRVRQLGRDVISIVNTAGLLRDGEDPYLTSTDLIAAGFGAANCSSSESMRNGISRAMHTIDLDLRLSRGGNLITRNKHGYGVRLNPLVRFIDGLEYSEPEDDFPQGIVDIAGIKERTRIVVGTRRPKVVAPPPQKKIIKPTMKPLSLAQPAVEELPPSTSPRADDDLNNWRFRAACAGTAVNFYPDRPGADVEKPAKQVCQGCKVRTNCLDEALESGEPFGIWGGLNAKERRDRLSNVHSITTTPRLV
jgi:WhiB family transcriptional regulator, redox-sensing transcriptional regulator